jgi:hypothetical protein
MPWTCKCPSPILHGAGVAQCHSCGCTSSDQ